MNFRDNFVRYSCPSTGNITPTTLQVLTLSFWACQHPDVTIYFKVLLGLDKHKHRKQAIKKGNKEKDRSKEKRKRK